MLKTTAADRRIWKIAGPSIAANCSAALIGLVDTWAIGHLPDPALLAAVGLGAFLTNFVYWMCGFLRMGTTGQVARAHGREDAEAIARLVLRALIVGLVLGVAIVAARYGLIALGLAFFDPPAGLAEPVTSYTQLRLIAVPAVLAKLAVLGLLIGTARAGLALALEVTANLVNAGLTVLFVVGLGLGIDGAALGSVAAEVLAAGLAVGLAWRILGRQQVLRAARHADLRRLRTLLASLGDDALLILRTLCLLAGFALFWRLSAQLGATAAAVTQVLMQFVQLAALALDGIAYAAEAEIGRSVGRADRGLYRQMLGRTTGWSLAFAAATSALFCLFGAAIVAFFTEHEAVRQAAQPVLPWAAAMPMIAVWSYQFDGVFIGLGAYGAMVASMALAFTVFGLASLAVGSAAGLWAAFALFMAARGLSQAALLPWLGRRRFGTA
ncbi:MAG: MATE family efflux transporter [Rhodothalassiaceae bacterium]